MSANRWWTTSLSRMTVMTCRRACRSPRLAKVTSFSAYGRSRFAFASVVVIRPCSNSDVARLASISRWWAEEPPRRGPLVGVGMSVLPQAAGQGVRRLLPGGAVVAVLSVAGAVDTGPAGRWGTHPPAGAASELLGLLVGAVVVLDLAVLGAVLRGAVVGVGLVALVVALDR